MSDRTNLIEAQNLTKRVSSPEGELVILNNISFTVAAGEAIAVVGASGSGKSTLLGLLAGLDVPTTGRVLLNGADLSVLDEDARAILRAGQVGFVFQAFQLLPGLTAIENVMLPLELADRNDARRTALETLDRVGLTSRIRHYPNQLSGGEQQRCAIARAFSMQPKILFVDEPTGNLDQHTGAHIIELLFELNREQGATLVLVTHDDALTRHCHRHLKLDNGRLVSVEQQVPAPRTL